MAQLVVQITKKSLKSLTKVDTRRFLSSRLKKIEFAHVRTLNTASTAMAERLFTDSHEWIEINDKVGTVGISNYAQDALGDVVYAQLPEVGSIVKKNEEVGALESVKAASEIISPISGKIIEKNEAVENKPALINTSPYKEGWLFKVEMTDLQEIKTLMDEKSYEEFLKSDSH